MVSKEAKVTLNQNDPRQFLTSFTITYAFFTFPPTLYIASLWDWQRALSFLLGAIFMATVFSSTAYLLLTLFRSRRKWLLGLFFIKYPLLVLLLFALFKTTSLSPLFFTVALCLPLVTLLSKSLRLAWLNTERQAAFK